MPRRADRGLKQLREATILEAACRVIRARGLSNARMADIASEAGTSYGLVYHYFENKDVLFEAVSGAWWRLAHERLARCAGQGDLAAQLTALVTSLLELYQEHPDLTHVFITEISRSTANLTPARLSAFTRFIESVEALVRGGQARGELRADLRPRYLTYAFLGAVETLLSSMVLVHQPLKGATQRQRIADSLVGLFLHGAEPRASGATAVGRARPRRQRAQASATRGD